jgi:hypothetical protein
MKELFGGLIEFKDSQKLVEFVETMNREAAIKIVEGSLDYGQKNGLFTLEESYCIYKSLTIIKDTVNNYGNGYKGPSRVATVELDGDKKE